MAHRSQPLTQVQVRRRAIAAQGYAARYRRAAPTDIAASVRKLSCVQLDSIATVERSHLLVLGARVGEVAPGAVSKLLEQGALFEYWAHEACLVDIADYPLWRGRMQERRDHHWWGPVIDSDRPLAERILATIRERGPQASRHFEGKGGGGMWNLKPAKKMLDALWTAGELVVSGRQGFQRVYDLPERVLPAAVLGAPVPSPQRALEALVVRAVEARGVLTARGIVNHYKLAGGVRAIEPALAAAMKRGQLIERRVEDGEAPVYLPAGAPLDDAPAAIPVLLSPFENLLWDRDFVRRFFGFNHLIEVYKKQEQRAFGYYVLPLLIGDKLVGRADLKADRDAQLLRVKALHLEPQVKRSSSLEASFQRALTRLARTLRLSTEAD